MLREKYKSIRRRAAEKYVNAKYKEQNYEVE